MARRNNNAAMSVIGAMAVPAGGQASDILHCGQVKFAGSEMDCPCRVQQSSHTPSRFAQIGVSSASKPGTCVGNAGVPTRAGHRILAIHMIFGQNTRCDTHFTFPRLRLQVGAREDECVSGDQYWQYGAPFARNASFVLANGSMLPNQSGDAEPHRETEAVAA